MFMQRAPGFTGISAAFKHMYTSRSISLVNRHKF